MLELFHILAGDSDLFLIMQTQELKEKLLSIADEIANFPESDREELINDLLDNWEWNKRFRDPKSAKVLDMLAEEALAEFRAGKTNTTIW
jgi:hypothetical protein